MRARLSAVVLGASLAVLAGCGGGGGGGGSPLPGPTPTPSPSPTPAYQNRPAAAGDSFSYAGSLTEAFVRPPLAAGQITPAPNPTNSATIVTSVAQSVSVSQPATTFNGVASPFDFRTTETDTVQNGLKTSTTTTDDYYEYLTQGAVTDIRFLGSVGTDSGGDTFSTTIGTGNGLVDVVPETTGAVTPANNAAQTTSEVDASGATLRQITNADGSYSETGFQLAADQTDTAISGTLNADGSGSYTFPATAPEDVTYTVSAPQPNPSGGPERIAITLSVPADLVQATPAPGATPVTTSGAVNVWYPLPLVLSQQTLSDNGTVALPAACNVAPALSKSARQVVAARTTVDPLFGEIDVNSMTSYTEDNIGVACLVLSDVVTQYYDLSGQAQLTPLRFSSTPQQTTTTSETLGLESAAVIGAAELRSSAAGVRAATARFHAVLAKHRAARRAAFYRALALRVRQGVAR